MARITLRNPPQAAPDDKQAPAGQATEPAVKSVAKTPAAASDAKTVTIIDGSSGKRQDVVIGAGDPAEKADATHRRRSRCPVSIRVCWKSRATA